MSQVHKHNPAHQSHKRLDTPPTETPAQKEQEAAFEKQLEQILEGASDQSSAEAQTSGTDDPADNADLNSEYGIGDGPQDADPLSATDDAGDNDGAAGALDAGM
jgi:hypothetical protein